MRVKTVGLRFLILLALSLPVMAAAPRTVTIVVEQNGVPVADARVFIAADEMDAVGRTDAQGRVIVTTTSARISVVAEKGGARGSNVGTAELVTVAVSGDAK